jgi:chlorite dismutase
MAESSGERPNTVRPKWNFDVRESGRSKEGEQTFLDRRLFMQLLVFRCEPGQDPAVVIRGAAEAMTEAGVASVIYEDVNDPQSFGVLTWAEDPEHFVTRVRPLLAGHRLGGASLRSDFTMFGRTYSIGYEEDLPFWLIDKPQRTVMNEETPWAVWYPLRRTGAFATLPAREQGSILREHGVIGKGYGSRGLASDVRLACHGIDGNDNEFVIGLIGKELHPLSHVVQTMRKTRQTAEFIEKMGPFFVGRVARRTQGR